MKKILVLIFLPFILFSCVNELDKYLDTTHVKMNKTGGNQGAGEFSSSIDISGEMMMLKVKYHNPAFIVTTKDNEVNPDTFQYKFTVMFFSTEKPLALSSNFTKYSANNKLTKNNSLVLSEIVSQFYNPVGVNFEIPMYYFNQLPEGKNDLTIGVYCQKQYKSNDGILLVNEMLGSSYFSFNCNIPAIYSSKLICNGIELQNDSIWSPYNSDFSFGKGLPDVYWAVSVPAENEKDVSHFYAYTPTQWNSYGYTGSDTIEMFTYKADENLLISINDYDRVFGDEYLASWYGSFDDLIKNNNAGFLSFIHTNRFDYKFIPPVCINGKKNVKE